MSDPVLKKNGRKKNYYSINHIYLHHSPMNLIQREREYRRQRTQFPTTIMTKAYRSSHIEYMNNEQARNIVSRGKRNQKDIQDLITQIQSLVQKQRFQRCCPEIRERYQFPRRTSQDMRELILQSAAYLRYFLVTL